MKYKSFTIVFLFCSSLRLANAGLTLDFVTDLNLDSTPDTPSGFIEMAFFEWGAIPGGTGNLQSFVRMSHSGNMGSQQGYNSGGRPFPVPFKSHVNTSLQFTRDAQIGAVPVVDYQGIDYYEFLFDLNENNNTGSLLSIDDIQIYTSPTSSQTPATVSNLGALRYDLDLTMDNEIVMDHELNPGSGTTDMRMLVPVSNFIGALPTDYLYLFSAMGNKQGYEATGGNEEWAFNGASVVIAVPEPSSFLFVSLLSLVLGSWKYLPRFGDNASKAMKKTLR